MSKYIDAEKLKRSIEAQCRVLRAIGIDELTEMTDVLSAGFIQEIENAPAEDVVEVVRCRDCKYLDYVDEHEKWCMGRGNPATMVKDDEYCSCGERKDG